MTDDEIRNISAFWVWRTSATPSFELMVRTWLCRSGRATAKGLHKAAITFVSAPAQAQGAV